MTVRKKDVNQKWMNISYYQWLDDISANHAVTLAYIASKAVNLIINSTI